MAASGWLADPFGRHEKRFFNGVSWTSDVLDGELRGTDAVGNPIRPSQSGPMQGGGIGAPQYVVVARRPVGNGFAVAALTLGIVGAVFGLTNSFVSVLGVISGLLAMVLGLVGLRKVTRDGADHYGLAISGVILGSIAVLVASYTTWNYNRVNRSLQNALAAQASVPVVDANPATDQIRIKSCYQMEGSGSPAATGTFVNASRVRRSLKVTIAFHAGQQTVRGDGITLSVDPGEQANWFVRDINASFKPTKCTIAPPVHPIP